MEIQAKGRLVESATLTEKQKKLDVNKDGKISSDDLKKLRNGKTKANAAKRTVAYRVTSANLDKELEGVNKSVIAAMKKLEQHVTVTNAQYDPKEGMLVYFTPRGRSSDSNEHILLRTDLLAITDFLRVVEQAKGDAGVYAAHDGGKPVLAIECFFD